MRNPCRPITSFDPPDVVPRGVFAFFAKRTSFLEVFVFPVKCIALLISLVTLSLVSLKKVSLGVSRWPIIFHVNPLAF